MGITTDDDIQQSFLIKSFIHSNTDPGKQYQVRAEASEPQLEDVLLLAKNLFELREYKKCSNMLKEHRSRHPRNQSLIFYYYYSLWMSGLIRKEEEIYENGTPGLTQRAPPSLPSTRRSTTSNATSSSCTRAGSCRG